MKKLFYSIITITCIYQEAASAAWAMARSNLWQAPVENTFTLSMTEQSSPALVNACKDFENLVARYHDLLSDSEQARSVAFVFERARTQPLATDFPSKHFVTRFKLNIDPSGNILSQEQIASFSERAIEISKHDPLPYYTARASSLILDLDAPIEFKVLASENSLSTSILPTGLRPLPIQLVNLPGYGTFMDVEGKDSVCDLVKNKSSLLITIPARVQLSLDQQIQMKTHYLRLEQITNSIFNTYQKPIRRAAALGYKLGQFFQSIDRDRVDEFLGNTIDAYFSPETLDYNSLWVKSLNEPALDFKASSEPLQIQIKLVSIH